MPRLSVVIRDRSQPISMMKAREPRMHVPTQRVRTWEVASGEWDRRLPRDSSRRWPWQRPTEQQLGAPLGLACTRSLHMQSVSRAGTHAHHFKNHLNIDCVRMSCDSLTCSPARSTSTIRVRRGAMYDVCVYTSTSFKPTSLNGQSRGHEIM